MTEYKRGGEEGLTKTGAGGNGYICFPLKIFFNSKCCSFNILKL